MVDYHRTNCYVCNRRFNCYGVVGGYAICNRCYPRWYALKKAWRKVRNINMTTRYGNEPYH